MALHTYADLAHDDEDKYDLEKGMPDDYEAPDYPMGLRFQVSKEDLAKAGAEDGDIGDSMHLAVMGEVTAIHRDEDSCRVEIQVGEMADEDGHFFDMETPGYLCLCRPELEKMGLGEDCERGDLIHLVGMAKLVGTSDTEYGGACCVLQWTSLGYVGNESSESREG